MQTDLYFGCLIHLDTPAIIVIAILVMYIIVKSLVNNFLKLKQDSKMILKGGGAFFTFLSRNNVKRIALKYIILIISVPGKFL